MIQQLTQPSTSRSVETSPVDQLDQSFSIQTEPTIGVELELMLVDRATGLPVAMYDDLFAMLPEDVQARTQGEQFACQIEYATRPHRSLRGVRDELQKFVTATTHAAELSNATLLWSGNHPFWQYDPAMNRDCDRSRMIQQRFGDLMPQLLTCGIHFHVAVNRDKAIQVVDGLQKFMPLLVALSANSPLTNHEPSGCHSHRAAVWARKFPVCGLSGPFGDWQGFNNHVRSLRDDGLIETQKDLYYFVRPTRYGTIEVRCCDVPMSINQIIALTALVQLLVVSLQRDELPSVNVSREILAVELDRAIVDGPEALLTDHTGHRSTPMAWMNRLICELDSTAQRLGIDAALALAPSMLAENGSARQLRDFAETRTAVAEPTERVSRRSNRMLVATVATAIPAAVLLGYRFW